MQRSDIDFFSLNEIGRVVITTNKPLFFDPYKKNKSTGSFVLIDPVTHNTVAVGMIIDKLSTENLPSRITDDERAQIRQGIGLIPTESYEKRYNQKGATLWVTGLHGSGKNDMAFSLEKQLFEMGATVVLLDGSSVRSGLSKELDYSPADRAEHLRRVAEVCRLLNDQGIITICSFISPDKAIREQVAKIIGEDRFHLFYMDADIEFCKNYKPDFYQQENLQYVPGIDLGFDVPENPAVVLSPSDNGKNPEKIIEFCRENNIFPLQ